MRQFFCSRHLSKRKKMTWDEGLRYVAAERSQRKMKEDAVLNAPAVQFPPKIPGPHNTRMSGLSKSFDEFLSSHDTSGTPVEEEGSGSYVTAKRSISSGSPTFEEWIANSKNLNIYELSNTAEKKLIRRRLQNPNCRVRQAIAAEPTSAFMLGVAISIVTGIALGICISESAKYNTFRGRAPISTPQNGNPFSPPSNFQKKTIASVLSFLS